jgi:hypothetical protein
MLPGEARDGLSDKVPLKNEEENEEEYPPPWGRKKLCVCPGEKEKSKSQGWGQRGG